MAHACNILIMKKKANLKNEGMKTQKAWEQFMFKSKNMFNLLTDIHKAYQHTLPDEHCWTKY